MLQEIMTIEEKNILDKVEKFEKTNKAFVSGVISEEFEYSHKVLNEKFYKTRVKTFRFSGMEDFVPIIVSEVFIGEYIGKRSAIGKFVEIAGQFRSYNQYDNDGKKHLKLYAFATSINIYEKMEDMEEEIDINLIFLEGFICKKPVYRKTPKGREITDLLVAVNRAYNKSDYIPCIAWGRTAKSAAQLIVGDKIQLVGRIQSREYFLTVFSDEEQRARTAYEISITKLIQE